MDLPAYRNGVLQVRNSHKAVSWNSARLRPLYDPLGDLMGWTLVWVGTFSDTKFVRLKESWYGAEPQFARSFFTYHYGPYQATWDLETVKCNAVTVRIDGIDYGGHGYHIHDGLKSARIYQDSLKSPILADADMPGFLEAVGHIRLGRSVAEAFGLDFKP